MTRGMGRGTSCIITFMKWMEVSYSNTVWPQGRSQEWHWRGGGATIANVSDGGPTVHQNYHVIAREGGSGQPPPPPKKKKQKN